jgi:Transglutaminase family, C-terminal ig like domain
MRNIGLFAFGVTTLLIVPAALHRLTAGPKQLAELVARGASSLELNGATIEASVDRSLVDPGDKVTVTLVATAETPRKVTVEVLVLEAMGTYNGRVPEPPIGISHETLTLEAKVGGGAARQVTVTLRGNRKQREMAFGRYQIFVMSPQVATKLERLRLRARREGAVPGFEPMEQATPAHDKFLHAFYGLRSGDGGERDPDALGEAALIEVNTRPKDSAVAIRAPEHVAVAEPFTVVVSVTNPTRHAVKDLSVQLVEPSGLSGNYLGIAYGGDVEVEPAKLAVALAPHETKQVEFRVTAKRTGVLGVYAETRCEQECEYDERLSDGALEAIDVGTPAMAKR